MKKSLWKCSGPPGNPLATILTLCLSVSLLAGCGAGGASKSEATQYMAAETAAAAVSYNAAPAADAYDTGGVSEEGYYEKEEPEASGGSALTSSSPVTPASNTARKLIRNVSMTVETDTFDDLLKQLQEQVAAMSGYIEQSDVSGSSMNDYYTNRSRHAFMIARIPSNKLDQFIAVVEEKGNVTYRSESTQDVTLQYSDLESKKKTLTVEQDRIWALLEKADTLEAVIALEERLSEIRYELESMESRLRLYDNQVEYSTIDISLNEVMPIDFTPTAPETVGQRIQKGFVRNTKGVFETLTNLFIFLIAASPVWVPLALIVALIVMLVRKHIRKKQGKYYPPVPPSPSSEEKPS